MTARFALFVAFLGMIRGQGTTPKAKPADYPANVELGKVTLAAEYLVHSIPTPQGNLIANDYLVVEVAFFGPSLSTIKTSPDHFTLRINGKGTPVLAQLPGLVAGSIKYPDWETHPTLTATGQLGNDTVTVGPRPPVARFPGDPSAMPPPNQPTRITVEPAESIEHRVANAALPEGVHSLPRSGVLYFPHKGKTKNIHFLELLYDGPLGKTALKLTP